MAHVDPRRGEKRLKMSTGFIGVALALHLCGRVTLFGFSPAAAVGADGHYYNKTASRTALEWEIRHPWHLERDCLALVGKNPRVTIK